MSNPSFQAQGSPRVEILTLPVRHVSHLWTIYSFPDEFLPFLSLCGKLGSYAFFDSPRIFETSPFLPLQFSFSSSVVVKALQ